jgi:hypothetical protein
MRSERQLLDLDRLLRTKRRREDLFRTIAVIFTLVVENARVLRNNLSRS